MGRFFMRLNRENTALLIVDYQERLIPAMSGADALLKKSAMLIEGMKILGIPALVTRQYPKGLGDTAEPIKSLVEHIAPLDKMTFGCTDDPAISSAINALGRKTIVLCGIEAHVCVFQTALGLLETNFTVVLPVDCTSSRSPFDKEIAVSRMQSEGVKLSTAESILFEITQISGTDEFKSISKLVK
jgi:nicotinamidase-related amidase